ncbi:uncharacterized protein TRIVIDRAFT_46269 [Trichoderma virens Gv29-8]|uniref:Uncharacterized protein n=1 Tax=Hypocrea virens (strain Gv29-8 / FGSC 10586) TaxID=413071 RepID=G9N0S9_HYPVG|nr:uncharacterized protein TRIVIDRAFT_46269 [Trichoderma virens Gv29-8]EHK19362.1 hypothetical protein TRIVIDRAFT_46269 [Trichoderma virens Gv29-8]
MESLEARNLFSVNGLVAVITGGGSGLGRTLALALDANGASKVFVIGRRESKLQETASLGLKGSIIPVVGDVTSKESLKAAVEKVAAQTTHIDLLVVNSGIMGPSGAPPPKSDGSPATVAELQEFLWTPSLEEFSQVTDTNFTGAFYTSVAFLSLLDAANAKHLPPVSGILSPPRPRIIIMSSNAAFIRQVSVAGYAYGGSKAAATLLTKMLSTTLLGHHIRVNGIYPGPYHSEMTNFIYEASGIGGKGISEGSFPKEFIPLTRSGAPEDIAGIILWMAGAAGGYLNGSIIVTDGGRLSAMPSSY